MSKTMTRKGVLSDEHILKHCAIYSPIPMNMASKILHHDLNIHKESPFTTKKLKYQNPVPRPASFNTLANSLTRIGGGDVRIKEHLIKSFLQEINNDSPEERRLTDEELDDILYRATALYGGYDSNDNGSSDTVSTDDGIRLPGDPRRDIDDELTRRATELFEEIESDVPATPMSFPKIDEDEYRRRTSGRMSADERARQEAYADPGIAARAETTPGMITLRNRAIQTPAARETARRAHNESLTNLAPGLEVNSPAYMQALERAEEAYLATPRYNSPEYNRMIAQAAGVSGLNY